MAENCASIKSAEEIVSGMSLSLVKAELKKGGLPVKGKKASLMVRLIVVLKEAENQSLRKVEVRNRLLQFLQGDKGSAASTIDHLSSQSCNQKLSDIQLLRRKEMILKMDIDAVIHVKQDTSKSSSNNAIRMENRVQKLNGYMKSCSEVRDEIIALILENEIAEEVQRWIDYQRAIDNASDIA